MTNVLLTGMSGVGKSSLIQAFAGRGCQAVDTDEDGWTIDASVDGVSERLWDEERMRQLLTTGDDRVLFVSGCVRNQVAFYPEFDHIVLLTAPVEVTIARLRARTNNPYGSRPNELAEILQNKEIIEPLLRPAATLELDTSIPFDEVLAAVLAQVQR